MEEVKQVYKYKDLLYEKQFVKVLLGNVITRFGDGIDTIVFAWLVLNITGSASLSAITFGINGLPNVIFGLASGVLSSYYSKKIIMFICDIGRGTLALLTAILYIQGNLTVWHLFAITFLNSSFESFREPASVGVLPYIINEDKFTIGISLNSTLVQGSQFIGIVVAPLCISVFGLEGGLIIDAISFIICGLIIVTLKYTDSSMKKEKITVKSAIINLERGFLFLKRNKLAMNICIFCALANVLIIPISSLTPAYIQELGMSVEGLTFVQASMLIAMAIGGLIYPKINEKVNAKRIFVLSGILFGICVVLFAILKNFQFIAISVILIYFLIGFSIINMNVPINIAMVSKIENKYLSIVNGIMKAIILSITPITSFMVGAAVKIISIKTIFVILGTISIIIFFAQEFNKTLDQLN